MSQLIQYSELATIKFDLQFGNAYGLFVGMKADWIGIHIHIFLSDVERNGYYTYTVIDADFFGCRIWCGVGSVSEQMQINIVG
jgi:hypothetical protein